MGAAIKIVKSLSDDQWFFGVTGLIEMDTWTMKAPIDKILSPRETRKLPEPPSYPLPNPRDVHPTFRDALRNEGRELPTFQQWLKDNEKWFIKRSLSITAFGADTIGHEEATPMAASPEPPARHVRYRPCISSSDDDDDTDDELALHSRPEPTPERSHSPAAEHPTTVQMVHRSKPANEVITSMAEKENTAQVEIKPDPDAIPSPAPTASPTGFDVPTDTTQLKALELAHMRAMVATINSYENGCEFYYEMGGYQLRLTLTKNADCQYCPNFTIIDLLLMTGTITKIIRHSWSPNDTKWLISASWVL